MRVSLGQIEKFLSEQQDWLEARRERALTPLPYTPGMSLKILDELVTLHHDTSQGGPCQPEGGILRIGGGPEQFASRAERTLRALALSDFTKEANRIAQQLGLPPCPVRVKDTRTRWGSCSRRSGISLSWRLILAPKAVSNYVVAHEVAHRVHANHGPGFWRLVEQLVGEPSPQRHWLANNGAQLFCLGATQTVAALPPLAA
jgi:predicted metal-dependent hydrolase